MASLFALDHVLARDPVELDGAARAGMLLMAVPGLLRAAEDEQRPAVGRDLGMRILEARAGAQDAQASAIGFPTLVHIKEDGDQLAAGIGVDVAVALADEAAHRIHGRTAGEIDAEFRFDRASGRPGPAIRPSAT